MAGTSHPGGAASDKVTGSGSRLRHAAVQHLRVLRRRFPARRGVHHCALLQRPCALVILSVCVVLLWWRPLLDAVRQVQEAIHQAGVIAGWAWEKLVRR